MDKDALESLLKAWGVVYAERTRRHVEFGRQRSDVSHPIARAMQFAPGKRVSKAKLSSERGGLYRRRLMARAAQVPGLTILPAEFVDPIPCRETRRHAGSYGRPVPPELARVDVACRALEESSLLRGTVLRVAYCTEGDHQAKAEEVTARMREVSKDFAGVTVSRFRDELLFARIWMDGRLSGGA